MNNSLQIWIEENELNVREVNYDIYAIKDAHTFLLIEAKEGKIFDDKFQLILTEEEKNKVKEYDVDNYLFEFGGMWYYTSVNGELQLNIFKYIGKREHKISTFFTYLGVHGKYELLNGSRDYSDWCKKAHFYNYNILGICERNTLGGTLAFQNACKEAKIKPVFGEEIIISNDGTNRNTYVGKVFALDEIGWKNLLHINKIINVDNNGFISKKELYKFGKGLVYVFCSNLKEFDSGVIKEYERSFEMLFYQIDMVEYESNEKDKSYLLQLQEYFRHYTKKIFPILINDSYYLDKQEGHMKPILNQIGNKTYQSTSKTQYFKSLDDSFHSLSSLFKNKEKFVNIFNWSVANANWVGKNAIFEIEKKYTHLPKFELVNSKHDSSEDLFWHLINVGIEEKLGDGDINVWLERIEKEALLIVKGGFVDYFLILWDIVRWCKEQNILIGLARGSAAGSLISYCLGITHVNPLKFGLLFERFLTEARLKKGCPDIDIDFEALRREEVRKYMEKTYGYEFVCSVGTYGTLQLKQAIKDLARLQGIDVKKVNYMTSMFDIGFVDKSRGREWGWTNFFQIAQEKPQVKQFVQENFELVNNVRLLMHQPKSKSIHPCATLILPKQRNGEKMTIFDWLPVRKEDDLLVSEWEGGFVEEAGFLKEDILGVKQLDKFRLIIDLVKETTGVEIDIYHLPLEDEKVFELFKQGLNGDVFHFGSPGLTSYSLEVKPNNIEELSAMLAVYRPGPMYSGTHLKYVKLKQRREEPEYDFGLEEVTKGTYGLFIYQEQVMKAVQVLGGFSLDEAEGIRKAMGKMIVNLIVTYKKQFIENAVKIGCLEDEAERIWNKMALFAEYAFNYSHSISYSITGYICQWLKCHYPVQFWTAAFEFASKDEIPRFISEINRTNDSITILPPNINHSREEFYTNFETKTIYWSLLQIKQVGPVAVQAIIKERGEKGEYFSLKEFCTRMQKTKVNKQTIKGLILSGCFDEVEGIKEVHQRGGLLRKYYELAGLKEKDDSIKLDLKHNWYWLLLQKEYSALSYLNYREIAKETNTSLFETKYIEPVEFYTEAVLGKREVVVGGIVTKIIERKSKRGLFAYVGLDNNNDEMDVVFWAGEWTNFNKQIKDVKGKIMYVSGRVYYDSWRKYNVMHAQKTTKIKIL